MAKRYLGDTLDLHAGGVDLIFPHHEDEIAQSEGANGVPFARMWSHGEFLLTDGAKMAKRVGNVAGVEDLRTHGISAAAVRHFMFSVHYRKQLNLAEESLEASTNAVRRVGDFAERLANATGGTENMNAIAAELVVTATAAFNDDLNAPEAMGALFEFIRMVNAELDAATDGDAAGLEVARQAFALVNGVLDIVPGEAEIDDALGQWVEERLAARREARARRDFAAADAIRGELDGKGIAIEDTPQGTRWKKVR
jgi:cysteinyl-tRNA synthetase